MSDIRYINPNVPEVRLPDYGGERSEAFMPDTLDLQEMARLAVNGLTEPTDPENDFEIYWKVCLRNNPPFMVHEESDLVQMKFFESLPLMRLLSGSKQNLEVEKRWMEVLLQMQGPDGVVYQPKIGRPWAQSNYGKLPPGDHYMVPWAAGRALNAMTIYWQLTGEDIWGDAAKRFVDGLSLLAIREGDTARFPWHQMGVGGTYEEHEISQAIHNVSTYYSWVIQGLSNYYKRSGYEPAIELAKQLYHWVRDCSNHFGPDGSFRQEYPNSTYTHFHGHTMVLLAVLDYGLASGDPEAVEFARKGFEYGLTQGECRIGYFSEIVKHYSYSTHETCELADMIALALKLSEAGIGDYWDLADSWIRNMFAEGQLRPEMWDQRIYCTLPSQPLPEYATSDRVVERNVGTFGGWMAPNDYFPDEAWGWGIMHCCTGNGTRAIYYAWENTIAMQDGQLKVNLLLNRASEWVDVQSHIPYTGRVELNIKTDADLQVRIPCWTAPEEVNCTMNGEPRKLEWNGRFARVGSVQKRDNVTFTFPITERLETLWVEKRQYHAVFRGSTCVSINPQGKNSPLFQRQYLRSENTRWRKEERFLSSKLLNW